jgi:ubiquinone/menaquinone biosynthesis C-methylase UbiE
MQFEANQYGEVAGVYDILMAGVPHGMWLTRMERATIERGKTPLSVLDMACGTGLVTFELYKRGYGPIVGVDISEAMIAVSEEKSKSLAINIPFFVQDMAELDLNHQTFDWCVSMFDSVNYIIEPERLQQAFVKIYRHLNAGGVFTFDMNSHYALSTGMFTQDGAYGPVSHEWVSYWYEETQICRIEMDFWIVDSKNPDKPRHHFKEHHVQRAYSINDIKLFLTQAGFIKIEVFGNYSMMPPTKKSDRLLFVCEKP